MPKGPVYIRWNINNTAVVELLDEQVDKLVEFARQLEKEGESKNVFDNQISQANIQRECAESEEGHTFTEGNHGVCTKCTLSVTL